MTALERYQDLQQHVHELDIIRDYLYDQMDKLWRLLSQDERAELSYDDEDLEG